MIKTREFRCILATLSVVLILTASIPLLWAQGISGVRVVASAQNYRGPCPAKIRFTGTIRINKGPMTLNYQWERSDGAKGEVMVRRVSNPNARTVTVVDTWELSATHKEVWVKLRVRCGNEDVTSEPAHVTINCR
jgi:hypothetical protein